MREKIGEERLNREKVINFYFGSYGELIKAVYESYEEYKKRGEEKEIKDKPDLFVDYVLRRFPTTKELKNTLERGMIAGYIASICSKKENRNLTNAIKLATEEAEGLLSDEEERSGLDREIIREL